MSTIDTIIELSVHMSFSKGASINKNDEKTEKRARNVTIDRIKKPFCGTIVIGWNGYFHSAQNK